MQIKLIFKRKVVHLASFESEGFWNSEVDYLVHQILSANRARHNALSVNNLL